MIIDAHVHVVSADEKAYPLQPMPAPTLWFQEMRITVEQLLPLMDEAGVERAVLVQPVMAYSYDNSYATDSALCYPKKFVSVGAIDMLDRGAADCLSYWVQKRKMNGLRIYTRREDANWLDDPRTFPVWEQTALLHIPVCVHMGQQQIPRARRLLEHFPIVPLLLDHLAYPPVEEGSPYEAASQLFNLAKFPNLYLKFSTMNFDALGMKPGLTRKFFQRLIEQFGARRLMWGSNFSASHNCSYKEMANLARQSLSFLGKEEMDWLFGGTALSLWPALAME